MTRIHSLVATGLAGRKDPVQFQLQPGINVLVGKNGSGKTTLLRLLHHALENESTPVLSLAVESASVSISLDSMSPYMKRSIVVPDSARKPRAEQLGTSVKTTAGLYTMIVPSITTTAKWKTECENDKVREATWYHRYLPTSRLYVGITQARDRADNSFFRGWANPEIGESDLEEFFETSLKSLWTEYANEIVRDVQGVQEKGLRHVLETAIRGAGKPGRPPAVEAVKAFERLKEFLQRQQAVEVMPQMQQFESKFSKDSLFRGIVRNINEVERSIERIQEPWRKFEELIKKLFGNKVPQLSPQELGLALKTGESLSLARLSSGEKHALKILVEVLLAKDTCIIVDEPELSMHVDWQRVLLDAMRTINPHAQIIVATHSPEIVAEISDEAIFSL